MAGSNETEERPGLLGWILWFRRTAVGEVLETVVVALFLALLLRAFVVQAFYIPSDSMNDTLLQNDHILVNKFLYRIVPPAHGDIVVFRHREGPDVPPSPVRYAHVAGPLYWDRTRSWFFVAGPKDYIKRVIGVPGDRIRVEGGGVRRNGEPLVEPYVREGTHSGEFVLRLPARRLDSEGDHVRLDGLPLDVYRTRLPPEYVVPEGALLDDPEAYVRIQTGEIAAREIVVPPGHLFVMGDNRLNSQDSRFWGFLPFEEVKGKALVRYWPLGRLGIVR